MGTRGWDALREEMGANRNASDVLVWEDSLLLEFSEATGLFLSDSAWQSVPSFYITEPWDQDSLGRVPP